MPRRSVLLTGDTVATLDDHLDQGGGAGLGRVRRLGAIGTLDELAVSGLRGRGGAGFPTATKWRSVAAGGDAVGDRFVVVNGAEGEPGTFKDRALLRHNPYLMLEGAVIAARTLGAAEIHIALKASFDIERARVERAVAEAAEAGWTDGLHVAVVAGPDEYLFGEEKALLEVIEGEDPLPRLFPPYLYGLFSVAPQLGWSANAARSSGGSGGAAVNPTLVNNVESYSAVARILAEGGEWYSSMGTAESPGTVICTVSGDTVRHGVGEFELGSTVEEVILELGGGMPPGRAVRYVLSGVANPVLHGQDVATPICYERLAARGSGMGSCGFIVFDDRTDPVELAAAVSRFLWIESCGQCPACKLGSGEITELLTTMSSDGGTARELAAVDARLASVTDAARCYLPSQEQRVVASLLDDIRDPAARDGTEHRDLLITKIVDLVDDRFVLDERQRSKRPDWTHGP